MVYIISITTMAILFVLLLFLGNVCVTFSIDYDWTSGIYPGKLSFEVFKKKLGRY